MGRNSGGSGSGGGMSSESREMANKYLGSISDPSLKKSLADAMSDFNKEFGVKDNTAISLKDFGGDAFGSTNGMNQIKLDKGFESGKYSKDEARKTLLHELTHTYDKTDVHHSANVDFKGNKPVLKQQYRKIDKLMNVAYKQFVRNYGTAQSKAIGSYAKTNKHEWFAESLSSYMSGNKNNVYAKNAYTIAKMMKQL